MQDLSLDGFPGIRSHRHVDLDQFSLYQTNTVYYNVVLFLVWKRALFLYNL
jgi:hypothetical protein